MKEYKFTLDNIYLWNNALNDIFKWNANKDLILFALRGELYTLHFRLLHPLTLAIDNETIKFNILPAFTNRMFKDLLGKVDVKKHNIIMAMHYIENIDEDFLIIKKSNIEKFNFPFNKEIILMELHTSILSSNHLISKLDGQSWDFMFNTDFSEFNKKHLNIVKLFN